MTYGETSFIADSSLSIESFSLSCYRNVGTGSDTHDRGEKPINAVGGKPRGGGSNIDHVTLLNREIRLFPTLNVIEIGCKKCFPPVFISTYDCHSARIA